MTTILPDPSTRAVAPPGRLSLAARRLLARAIDLFTVFFLTFALAVTVLVAITGPLTSALDVGPWGRTLGPVLLFTGVGLLYETVFIAARGQTPGKDVLHIRVVDAATGETPDVGAALRRSVIVGATRLVPGVGIGTVSVLALAVTMPFDRDQRGAHDLAAGTRVVHHEPDHDDAVRSSWQGFEDDIEARYGPRSWWRAFTGDRLP